MVVITHKFSFAFLQNKTDSTKSKFEMSRFLKTDIFVVLKPLFLSQVQFIADVRTAELSSKQQKQIPWPILCRSKSAAYH